MASEQHNSSFEAKENLINSEDVTSGAIERSLKHSDIIYLKSLLHEYDRAGLSGESRDELEKLYRETVGCEFNSPYYFKDELFLSDTSKQYTFEVLDAWSRRFGIFPDGRLIWESDGELKSLPELTTKTSNVGRTNNFQVLSNDKFLVNADEAYLYERKGTDLEFSRKSLGGSRANLQSWMGETHFIDLDTSRRLSFRKIDDPNRSLTTSLGEAVEFMPLPLNKVVVRAYKKSFILKYDTNKETVDKEEIEINAFAMTVSSDGRIFLVEGHTVKIYMLEGIKPILVDEFELNIPPGNGPDDCIVGSVQIIGKNKLLFAVSSFENPLVIAKKFKRGWNSGTLNVNKHEIRMGLTKATMTQDGRTIIGQGHSDNLTKIV